MSLYIDREWSPGYIINRKKAKWEKVYIKYAIVDLRHGARHYRHLRIVFLKMEEKKQNKSYPLEEL